MAYRAMRFFLASVFAVLLAACGQSSAPATAPAPAVTGTGVEISEAYASPTPGGVDVSAGYLTIVNHAAVEDRLTAVSSPRAAQVEIHEMAMDGGVMSM